MAGIYDPTDPDYLKPGPRTASGTIDGPLALNTATMGARSTSVPRAPVQMDAAGMVLPQPSGGGSSFFGDLNNAAAYGPDVLGGNPVSTPAQGNPAPTIAVTPPAQREALPAYQPQYNALAPGLPAPGALARSGNNFSATGAPPAAPLDGMTDAQRNNAPFHADYLALQDRNRVEQAQADAAQQANARGAIRAANAGEAGLTAARTSREAEMADFLARNGADAVLGPSSRTQARAILAGQQNARDRANIAQGQYDIARNALAQGGQQDYLGDRAKGEEVIGRAAASRSAQALGDTKVQEGQLTVQHQQRINQLGALLADPKTDPKARESAQTSLLAMLGKDKPEEYAVQHVAGGQVLGPDGISLIKQPDQLFIVNKRTGKYEQAISMGQQQPPNGGYASLPAAHAAAKQAIYGGMSKADANARLKNAGLPELP